MSLHRLAAAALVGCCSFAPAGAQTTQTLVITGTRVPQPAEQSPLDLRVIDRAQIERARAQDWLVEWKAIDDATLAAMNLRLSPEAFPERGG